MWADGVAIDNIQLIGDKDVTAVDWTTTPANIIDLYVDTDNDIAFQDKIEFEGIFNSTTSNQNSNANRIEVVFMVVAEFLIDNIDIPITMPQIKA